MRKLMAPAGIFAVTLLLSAPATAQSNQTWVSASGTDAGLCPVSAPCRNVSFAVGPTSDGGEIHVIGPILQESIIIGLGTFFSIIAEGHAVFSPNPSFDDGYVIAAGLTAVQEITLRGLHIDQQGSDTRGVWIQNAGTFHIEDCVIWNCEDGYAIDFAPSGAAELYISNCVIRDSGAGSNGGGIRIRPTGSGSAKVVLKDVRIENNRVGILIDGAASTGGIDMSVSDSTISGGTGQGLSVFEAVSGAPSAVVLERTTISSNGAQGIFASRALASVRVRQSAITGNAVGIGTANGGQIISHGDNVLAGNTTNGAFTSTLPPQ